MSSIDVIKSKYKPYRYTKENSVTIIESTSGKFVIKKQNKDLYSLFNYLSSRGFDYYPKIVYNHENRENVFEYIEDDTLFNEQKVIDLALVLSALHERTSYIKNVSVVTYKEIKENIENNINYLKNYYETLFLTFISKEYQNPYEYLYTKNHYKIKQCLKFCEDQINLWYEEKSNDLKQKVSVINNNVKMEHFRQNSDNKALISWDNYKIDTPILDLVSLYKNEYLNYDFSIFLEKYFTNIDISDSDKTLFFILISLPDKIELEDTIFNNTIIIRNLIDYIYKTENLLKPYFS